MFMLIGEETKTEQIMEVLEKGGTIVIDRMDPEIDNVDEFVDKLHDKLEANIRNFDERFIVFEDEDAHAWCIRAI